MKKQKTWFFFENKKIWIIIFSVVFLLSIDFWNWGNYHPLIFGLPFWLIYNLFLTLILSILFLFFSKIHWREQ